MDYLRHPDFIFDNQVMAADHRDEAYAHLQRVVPGLKPGDIHVAPLGGFY